MKGRWLKIGLPIVFVLCVAAGIGLGLLLTNINQRIAEGEQFPAQIVQINDLEIDPAVWGLNYPRQYNRYIRTQEEYGRTPYGGNVPYDKLEAKPFLRKAWAGLAFSLDYNEDRGHFYAQIDQAESLRTTLRDQPGACLNCHTGEFTLLLSEMSWEEINSTPYNHFRDRLAEHSYGVVCADCHEPQTMQLRITRPALENALSQQGIDWREASRQEMRSYVCAQCHVEYYFLGEDRTLTFPWSRGTTIEAIEQHYDTYGFSDWTHALTQAPMIKIQHPEYELFTSSTHYTSGVSCADCHMPYTREGGVKISDHWIRSPLMNINNACQTCHKIPEQELFTRVITIQNRTKDMMTAAEVALSDAIDAIVIAMDAGVSDEALDEARALHRAAQMRWDFIDAENSMGFHSPQEAVRVLGHASDMARQSQFSAAQALGDHRQAQQAVTLSDNE